MDVRELTHNDPSVIEKFGNIDKELVIGFLELRKFKGKANHRLAMRAVFRQLDRCETDSQKEATLENAICDNAHWIYDRHLPESIRFPKRVKPEMTYLQRVAAGLEDPDKPQEPKTYLQRVAAGLEE